jgi:hypothetical protein
MRQIWTALAILPALLAASCSSAALAKDTCTPAWGKGGYKSHKQVEHELSNLLANAKILRFSLCGSGSEHYFQVTILEAIGKVRVIRVPAR